ncbi:MAG: hypothetical protein AAFX06_09335 [Planctomycetota bacterium]
MPSTEKASSNGRTEAQSNASFARFLYTQNPFYLISCLLVIYGCQSLAISSGDVLAKSVTMTGGLAMYTVLMSFVCIAVVRIAKVWQDARSIFIVVLISLAAMTTGFDELCISNREAAMGFSLGSIALVVIVLESVKRFTRLRLGFWYSIALYAHFAVLIGIPNGLGYAVASRNDAIANWGAMQFSMAIAAALLLLTPAVRRGIDSTKENGTPWSWPLFPLAAFFVLIVLAGIRAHAVWMSFGFYGVASNFEPFLLLPIGAVVLFLIAECGLGTGNESIQRAAVFSTPGLLLCGLSNHGDTWLPIRADLQLYLGSSWTACLSVCLVMYAWLSFRGVRYAPLGIPSALLLLSGTAELPRAAEAYGLESWMIAAVVSGLALGVTLRNLDSDWAWLAFAASVAMTLVIVGEDYDQQFVWRLGAGVFSILSMLILGAVFDTPLATWLRHGAASLVIIGSAFSCVESLARDQTWPLGSAALVACVTFGYASLVRRSGWLLVSAIHTIAFVLLLGWSSRDATTWRLFNWPIASGLACLGVGLAITTSKAGVYQQFRERRSNRQPTEPKRRFRPGL